MEHWARLGQSVSNQTSASRSRVEAALAGKLASEDLTTEEAVVFDAEIATLIKTKLPTINHVEERATAGYSSVILHDGVLIECLRPTDHVVRSLMSSPRLDLVAGCNGAGKSTLIRTLLRPALPGSTYVNADDIAHSKWPGDEEKKSYEAARLADHARTTLLEHGHPFITETVFSHPSKLELIDEAIGLGFRVVLHIVMVPEEVAVRRVHSRVLSGGHSVPEDKIRARYQRPLRSRSMSKH